MLETTTRSHELRHRAPQIHWMVVASALAIAIVAFFAGSQPAIAGCPGYSASAATISPCVGPPGTTVTVTMRRKNVVPASVSFLTGVNNGIGVGALTAVTGSATGYSFVVPAALCTAGSNSVFAVRLADSTGQNQGEIGRFTIDCRSGATSSMNAQHHVYDVAKDFSTTKNPNGVWSYGYESKLGSRFIRNVKHVHVSGLDAWQGALSSVPLQAPVVFHNGTASTITYLTLRMQAGQLAIHPGPHGECGVARWIAPRAGAFRIHAIFLGVDTVGTTTDVHVLVGGARIFDAAINARSSRAELNRVVSLKKGAIVDFAVGIGADGTYYYDTTALAATISE
jgi:hypothetical protein